MEMKKGISMISLIITVIIIFILLATSIAFMGNAVDNSRISSFANDLFEMEEVVKNYYLQNDVFPTIDGQETPLSKAQVIALVPNGVSFFDEELSLNGDNVSNDNLGSFYKVDMNKIGIVSSSRGLGKDASDYYVVAYPSMRLYYLKGVEAKSKYYFSLSTNITSTVKLNKINDAQVSDYTSVISAQGITARRENKKWTNKVNMYIDTYVDSGETLYIKIGDGAENLLQTVQGQNTIYFKDTFTSYNNITQNRDYTISSATLAGDITAFNSKLQNEKKVVIVKKKSGSVVANLQVDFSNYEVEAPEKTQKELVVSKEEYNLFTIKMQDYISGLKEVRYEYLTRFNEDATEVSYYDGISRYDEAYMRSRAKIANLSSDGVVEIQVPKDVSSIQLAGIDNAGNITQVDGSNYIIENTSTYVYVGINEVSVSKKSANVNFVVKTDSVIKSATCSYSINGLNFVNIQNLDLVKQSNSVYKAKITYDNLTDVTDKVYIKVEIVYLDTKEKEIRIKEIPISNTSLYATHTYAIEPQPGNKLSIAIPIGFTPVTVGSDGSIKEYIKSENWNSTYFNDERIKQGVVIIDKYGNQFVWIPVESSNYTNRFSTYPKESTITSVKDARKHTLKYGGFYVGRYESSFTYDGGDIGVAIKKSENYTLSNWSHSRTSAYSGYLWNYISCEDAIIYSRKMAVKYGYSGVSTDLINGTQWDSMMYFLSQNGINVTNSSTWGNYGSGTIQSPNGDKLNVSGSSINFSVKNIYDIAGNLSEYTNEFPNDITTSSVARGGSYRYSGESVPAAYRYLTDMHTELSDIGFRVVMCFE